ncbi:uncharacterized protein F4812DRAFT_441184 [Daldinia caldariorum]|uniref:uncharacterized protein n=1 Tax=Daldinia caldariorum TaxID=326644 RepID=UPI002007874C|nr:uncharacterized protein F4812DRAFT_441184 [Daldinia caldariorum]KAI1464975.1 hypothetical protein F4812DRAFT_441184 [Daldinia caldariorum]
MALTEQNDISIAEIAIYTPALFVAIWLCIRHGFGRSSGWLYLIIFSLARIIGAAMQLATISDPKSLRLRIGAATLQNIGLSPLMMVQLALIGRAAENIQKSTTCFVTEQRIRFIHLIVLVGLVLGAIGGSQSGQDLADTGKYTVSTLSQAGTGLMIAAYILLALSTALVAVQMPYMEAGSKRLVLAVGLSLPFILVRLAYSAESLYGNNPAFNQVSGDINIQLGMSVIMEMIVVAIVESIGMTLPKITKSPAGQSDQSEADYEMIPK